MSIGDLHFSQANAKLEKLYAVRELKPYLFPKKKVYSFDLLSGHSCPSAKECQSFAMETKDGLRIQDGKFTEFRCFSASNEAVYKNVYNLRKRNLDKIRELLGLGIDKIKDCLLENIPKNAGIIRPHVAGDYFVKNYLKAWIEVIKERKDILFYSYTKQLKLWVDLKDEIDKLPNFCLTASYGGHSDFLIEKYGLRNVRVVYSQYQARKLKLPLDHDDSHACRPSLKNKDFLLMIHGVGPKGSKHAKAWQRIKSKGGGYGRQPKSKN